MSAAAGILPAVIAPMLATAGPAPTGSGWAFEFKWDGVRAITYTRPLRVLSRTDRDVTDSYPELAETARLLARRRAVVDGEIVALDADGRPSFTRLQQRMHVRAPTASLTAAVPVRYYVFDLLHLDGRPTLALPYHRRRELLAGLDLAGDVVAVPDHVLDTDGTRMLATAAARGLEGVLAKRLTSVYQPGRRSPDWIKTPLIRTQETVIVGYLPGAGRRAGTVGSLLLAVYEPGVGLRFAGAVGTGFTQATLDQLHRRLTPLRRATPAVPDVPREQARAAVWVEPRLVGEVAYRTWSPDARLRHASWRGLRPDRAVTDTIRAAPVPAAGYPPAAARVDGAMQTPDGAWRVEAVRRGPTRWYRIAHGDNMIDGLSLADVERVLAGVGVDLADLVAAGPVAGTA
jgi:bifunctional non-homologous end joining protein LigD